MIRLKGLEKLEKDIAQIDGKTMSGIRKAMNYIHDKSQPLVPVDTGRLKRSVKIKQIQNKGFKGYQIGYKALNKGYDYAPIQHENKSFNHRVGQAKYLEEPIAQNLKEIEDIILREMLR